MSAAGFTEFRPGTAAFVPASAASQQPRAAAEEFQPSAGLGSLQISAPAFEPGFSASAAAFVPGDAASHAAPGAAEQESTLAPEAENAALEEGGTLYFYDAADVDSAQSRVGGSDTHQENHRPGRWWWRLSPKALLSRRHAHLATRSGPQSCSRPAML